MVHEKQRKSELGGRHGYACRADPELAADLKLDLAIGSSMNKQVGRFGAKRISQRGFSLIEMIVALAVLSIGMAGGLALVAIGIGRNTSTRMDTTAASVAQTILEDIASTPAQNGANTMTIADCTGNNLTITTAVGGAGDLVPAGGDPAQPGTNEGDIDFTLPAVPGYQATYLMTPACSGAPGGTQIAFDVRWAIQPVAQPAAAGLGPAPAAWAKLIIVAAPPPFSN